MPSNIDIVNYKFFNIHNFQQRQQQQNTHFEKYLGCVRFLERLPQRAHGSYHGI